MRRTLLVGLTLIGALATGCGGAVSDADDARRPAPTSSGLTPSPVPGPAPEPIAPRYIENLELLNVALTTCSIGVGDNCESAARLGTSTALLIAVELAGPAGTAYSPENYDRLTDTIETFQDSAGRAGAACAPATGAGDPAACPGLAGTAATDLEAFRSALDAAG